MKPKFVLVLLSSAIVAVVLAGGPKTRILAIERSAMIRETEEKLISFTGKLKEMYLKFLHVYLEPDFVNIFFKLDKADRKCYIYVADINHQMLNDDEQKIQRVFDLICPKSFTKFILLHHAIKKTHKILEDLYSSIVSKIPTSILSAQLDGILMAIKVIGVDELNPRHQNFLVISVLVLDTLVQKVPNEDYANLAKNLPAFEPLFGNSVKAQDFKDYVKGIALILEGYPDLLEQEKFYMTSYKMLSRIPAVGKNLQKLLNDQQEHKYDADAQLALDDLVALEFKHYNATAPFRIARLFQ